MRTTIKMPQLGESIAEGTIRQWLKQPGDAVRRDEPLAEIETDKATVELPSPAEGVVAELLVTEGSTVEVRTEIAVIEEGASATGRWGDDDATGRDGDAARGRRGGGTTYAAAQRPALPSIPSREHEKARVEVGRGDVEDERRAERRFYTPVVLRMAQEHSIDLERIEGTGLGGRVTRKDVERAMAERPAARAVTEAAVADDGEVQPLTPMRRGIARHLSRARAEIPDAWCMVEVDATSLARLRAGMLPEFQEHEGFELTYLPFFVRAILHGLRAVPAANATWNGDSITLHRHYHLGIAVSLEQGLVVPVLRDADQYDLIGLAKAIRRLVDRTRAGKLSADELQDATFTVNNPGALGSVMSQPIVPLGQSAIVTMEAIVKRPVVRDDDALAVRSMMNCCLSFDHRVLDGAQALAFLGTIKRAIEQPDGLLG